ncbi:MAG: LacI family DNA-binding transcriptional regulator [Lachnospiraceae bacterium]|nr:LacI family DNA-binding transcriptional regulator [Candidatus Darwinimomas equi]
MVSIKDIAIKCGVSVATVSKALNDKKDIGPDTKDRIRQVADEMGYFSNAFAKALKTNRSYNIGVLFVDEQHSGLRHEFYSYILESFKALAEEKGYDITFIHHSEDNEHGSYLRHCRHRGVDGVMIACVDYNLPEVKELIASDIPIVTVDYDNKDVFTVFSDNARGISTLVRYAYEMGHRKIAYMYGDNVPVTDARLAAFHKTCKELQLDIPMEYVIQSPYHEPEACAENIRRFFELKDMPTCILLPDDFAALGGINELQENGFKIPEDISVIGYDGLTISKIMGLTTWKQNSDMIGKAAAEKLIEMIEDPDAVRTGSVTVDGEIIKGASLVEISR